MTSNKAPSGARTSQLNALPPALLLAVAALPGVGTAQEKAAGTSTVLEEVIVTAERREQSVQDVPISVTVFTAEDLARRGINNLGGIQFAAPSIVINTVNRSTFINIRGVGIAQ